MAGNPAADDQKATLLNLIKSNTLGTATPPPPQQPSRAVSGFAAVYGANGLGSPRPIGTPALDPLSLLSQRAVSTPPVAPPRPTHTNPQDYLLSLLSKHSPAPSAAEPASPLVTSIEPVQVIATTNVQNPAIAKEPTPVRVFGSVQSRDPTPFDPDYKASETAQPKKPIFTYVNPFDQFNKPSPKVATPAPTTVPEQNAPKTHEVANTASFADAPPAAKLTNDALQSLNAPTNDPSIVAKALQDVAAHAERQAEFESTEKQENTNTTNEAEATQSRSQTVVGSDNEDVEVPVYEFVLSPFTSIDISKRLPEKPLEFRESVVKDISRFKKEFDQIDRTLATASNDFIVYASPKTGGIRAIRQDDGRDKQLFKETKDMVFNVTIASEAGTSSGGEQALISTGASGTVYWTSLLKDGVDLLESDQLAENSIAFPPVTTTEEHTSAGQLKTRAKRSSRHPRVFAIGRGKNIHLVFPYHALKSDLTVSPGVIDTEKYLKERCFKINIGKAGKDFAFSDDDTTLASLDKLGRLRFWDIEDLMNEQNGLASKIAATTIYTPMYTINTVPIESKSPCTSLFFCDKARAHAKNIALRYAIIGLRQNHTIQLWDFAVGKAVQEINLPHEHENDGICSIAFHPETGIIVVGHPTRNSIYFFHLSPPKYQLNSMSQAKYIKRLADRDPTLQRPNSTAIITHVSEYSFRGKWQLRSLDILSTCGFQEEEKDKVFELYVMHAKGVTCLHISMKDLGVNGLGKPFKSLPAESSGFATARPIEETTGDAMVKTTHEKSDPSTPSYGSKASVNGKGKERGVSPAKPVEVKAQPAAPQPVVPKAKEEEKKALQPTVEEEKVADAKEINGDAKTIAVSNDQPAPSKPSSVSYAQAAGRPAAEEPKPAATKTEAASVRPAPNVPSTSKDLGQVNPASVSTALRAELNTLYSRFAEDKRIMDAASIARQDAILRLVSSTLNENTEKSLSRIVKASITENVVPELHTFIGTSLSKELPKYLDKSVSSQLKAELNNALSSALQTPALQNSLAEALTPKITKSVEKALNGHLSNSLLPAFQKQAMASWQKIMSDAEKRFVGEISRLDIAAKKDAMKIDELSTLVNQLTLNLKGVSEVLSAVGESVREHREESRKAAEKIESLAASGITSTAPGTTTSIKSEPVELTQEQVQMASIEDALRAGRYEEATIEWLRSSYQSSIYDTVFSSLSPSYLSNCSKLVVLSAGAAISALLAEESATLPSKLSYIETILKLISSGPLDDEISSVKDQIMEVLVTRLEGLYMSRVHRGLDSGSGRELQGWIGRLSKTAREVGRS